ncbi:MAG: ABC transporter ATP-binding protein [Saprospiraceae bacterium]
MSNSVSEEVDSPKKKVSRESFKDAIQIFEYVRPYRWYVIIGLLLLFLSSLVFMAFPKIIGEMLKIADGEGQTNYTLGEMGWLIFFVLIAQGVISYLRVILFAISSEKGIADVRRALYKKLIAMPVVFYEESRVGELISRLTADVEQLYSAFSIVLAEFIRQVIIVVVGIVLITISIPKLAFIMLATFPVVIIGAMFFGRYIRKLSKQRQQELAETNTILSETMQSINMVKSFTNEWYEINRYGGSVDSVVKIAMKFARGRALFSTFIVSILFGALFFIIWQAVLMIQNGEIHSGDMIEFVAYTAILGISIGSLGNFYTQLLSAIGATERVREILNAESEVDIENGDLKDFPKLKGDIRFDDVRFSYPTRDDVEVLKGINLDIKAGQKVALVGTSGAGKSTIMQLLLRFYNFEKGTISVDQKDIKDFEITAFRKNMAIVPQEVMLFGGTIHENILYGRPGASEADVINAAKQSNSWKFIKDFPDGLDTIVGERGVKLSGGQRQRIAIARAILNDPSILLLDEATSSLDAESERLVQEALNTLMQGRTSIIIAHRLATIKDVDCIYVIDGGKIIEQGTHRELADIENGAYSNLAKLQFETM